MTHDDMKAYYEIHVAAWKMFLTWMKEYKNEDDYARAVEVEAKHFINSQPTKSRERYAKALMASIFGELVHLDSEDSSEGSK